MYFKMLLLLQFILIFCIETCLNESNESADIYDCNCDVQIGVIESFMDKMESQEKLVKQIHAECVASQPQLVQKIRRLPTNCMEAAAGSFKSGIYTIQLNRFNVTPFTVWCDEQTDFGGWIVIQRRVDANVNFSRNWQEYKDGFGDLSGSYWIGLEKMHALTASCEQELYIKMETFNGKKYYMKYDLFIVGSEKEGYVLKKVSDGKGNIEDNFQPHEGNKFTTLDRDNDEKSEVNCAIKCRGGWWYNRCYWSNLNGDFMQKNNSKIVVWLDLEKEDPMKFVQMMIRPTEKCMKRLAMKNVSL